MAKPENPPLNLLVTGNFREASRFIKKHPDERFLYVTDPTTFKCIERGTTIVFHGTYNSRADLGDILDLANLRFLECRYA